jgi:uncharacterized oxidoreductase
MGDEKASNCLWLSDFLYILADFYIAKLMNYNDIRKYFKELFGLFMSILIIIIKQLSTLTFRSGLLGTMWMTHQFLPHLTKQKLSAIVNISSGLAFLPFPLSPIYSAAKSGIHAYTQVLRLQLKNTNIKVFELAPPATDTTLMDSFSKDLDKNSAGPIMKVEKMVQIAIDGFLKDIIEIKPGMSKALSLMGRIAPNFFLKYMDKTLEKAMAKK